MLVYINTIKLVGKSLCCNYNSKICTCYSNLELIDSIGTQTYTIFTYVQTYTIYTAYKVCTHYFCEGCGVQKMSSIKFDHCRNGIKCLIPYYVKSRPSCYNVMTDF